MNKLMAMQSRLQAARKKKGFSLVELMIVIAVIAILFVVLVSRAGFATNKAKEAGVKTDFRAFSTAADQLLREKSGMSEYDDIAVLSADMNLYLDEAMKFDETGKSALSDPWNKLYTLQFAQDATNGAGNNGGIIVCSGGQDGILNGTDETTGENNDYVIAVLWKDGYTHTATTGFSSNIEETYFKAANITDATAAAVTVNASQVASEVTYNADGSSYGETVLGDIVTNTGHN